jgi:hypothetical protein
LGSGDDFERSEEMAAAIEHLASLRVRWDYVTMAQRAMMHRARRRAVSDELRILARRVGVEVPG